MSERIFVGTRKGLFTVQRGSGGWCVERVQFLGDPVALVLHDPRDGTVFAVLDTGHFGIKLHRSSDGGESFEEIPAPVYPEQPKDEEDISAISREPVEWKLSGIWSLAAGGADREQYRNEPCC